MKTITIKDGEVETTICLLNNNVSSMFCDVTIRDNGPLVRINTIHGDKNNTVDLSQEGVDYLKTLFL